MEKYKNILKIDITKSTYLDLTKKAKQLTTNKKLMPLARDYLILKELSQEYKKQLRRGLK